MKLLVLNNVVAGFGPGPIYDFVRLFSEPGDQVTIRSLDPASNFAQATADAADFDAVVAAGGDGTHSSICYQLRGSGVPVLPFPSGTANLMTQNLLFPEEPAALANLVRECRTLDFDMGELETTDGKVGFSMMAGCGYDAIIMNDAKKTKEALGPISYFKAALDNPRPPISHFVLDIDGKTVEADGVGILIINFSKIQFDISLGPANRPRDGLLDVLVMRTKSAWELLPPIIGAAVDHSGTALKNSGQLSYYRGRTIRVQADPALPVQFDGEAKDLRTPFTARVLPAAVRMILGTEGLDEFGG